MRFTLFLLAACMPAFADLGFRSILEINASGNAANSGWFNPSNSNFATDLVVTGSTGNTATVTVSSASYTFVSGDTAYKLFIQDGSTGWYADNYTNYGCWYPITSVSGGVATLNAAIGAVECLDPTKGMPSPKMVRNTVVGVAATDSPTGGKWTLDKSQATTPAHIATNTMSSTNADSACTISVSDYTFTVADRGNSFRVVSGTGWTPGIYEITATSGGVAASDRACGTTATPSTTNVARVGGAFAFGGGNDDSTLEHARASAGTGAARIFIKGGTHTLNGSITIAANGQPTMAIVIEGYGTLRGDLPTGTNRPLVDAGVTNAISAGSNWDLYNLRIKGDTGTLVSGGTNSKFVNNQIVNLTTTASRNGLTTGNDNFLIANQIASLRGRGLNLAGTGNRIIGNHIHSSDTPILVTGTGSVITGNLIEDFVTTGINISTANTSQMLIVRNTIAGGPEQRGTCLSFVTATTDTLVEDNIISGCTTVLSYSDTQNVIFWDYNNLFNNGSSNALPSGFYGGGHDVSLNPGFLDLAQITDTGATTSGSTLTASGAKDLSGVVPGRDYLYISSTSGGTAGMYDILSVNDGADTVTSATSMGSGTSVVWSIVTGRNYCPGTNMSAIGSSETIGGSPTTNDPDLGACQRFPTTAGGGTIAH